MECRFHEIVRRKRDEFWGRLAGLQLQLRRKASNIVNFAYSKVDEFGRTIFWNTNIILQNVRTIHD